jgi:hypothetical protein
MEPDLHVQPGEVEHEGMKILTAYIGSARRGNIPAADLSLS